MCSKTAAIPEVRGVPPPCHSEERSDEGSFPRAFDFPGGPGAGSKKILRCAQDDRVGEAQDDGVGEVQNDMGKGTQDDRA